MPSAEEDPDVQAIARIDGVPTILEVITQTTGLRLALVARVTADDWKACAVHDALGFGMKPGDHLDVATTLCSEVRSARAPIVIEHASTDAAYCDHRTPRMYNFESYIAVPIFLGDGQYFGNVCALDKNPLPLRERKAEEMMTLFARLIGLQLDSERRADATRAALLDAKQTAELREQFIAVLGHDLRNPLGAVMTGAEMLLERGLGEPERRIVERIRNSGRRMGRLVDDVLDFARGRLGGGITLERASIEDLNATFNQVVEELQVANPDRDIRLHSAATLGAMRGDRVRLGQLLSNLLANAIHHGAPRTPVDVVIDGSASDLIISVTNRGEPIAEATRARLFEPFVRGMDGQARSTLGLGLGLYIASEIVRSHGGTITVASTKANGTTFRCVIPRG